MITIGRDKQFDDIMNRLEGMQNGSICHVHVSVAAPRRGGLSTFLEDLHGLCNAKEGLLPVHFSIENGLDGQEVRRAFAKLFDCVCKELAIEEEFGESLNDLLGKCNELKKHRILPVLILDVAAGIREIEAKNSSLEEAKQAPLFNRLRVLVNMLNDQDSNLAVVVGWDDKFKSYSGSWGATDVWQRYSAQLVLWSDFENDSPWKLYHQILTARGYEVDGCFPGFPRSGIPVGKLLDALDANGKVVDGVFLLDLLKEIQDVSAAVDENTLQHLVSILLEDSSLSSEQVSGNAYLETGTVLTPDGNYVASEDLYAEWGIKPARSLISLERQTRQAFEDRPESICKDIATGVAHLTGTLVDSINELGDFCYFESTLKGTLLHDRINECKATVVVWLGEDETDQLYQFIKSKINEFEINSEKRFSNFLFLLHRTSYTGANKLGGRLVEDLEKVNSGYQGMEGGESRAAKKSPVSFCNVSLSIEDVIELRYLSRDPNRESAKSTAKFKSATKKHWNQIWKSFPRLAVDMFDSPVLRSLIGRSFMPSPTEHVAEKTGLTPKETNAALRDLRGAGIINENKKGEWLYRPMLDRLLREIGEKSELADSFYLKAEDQARVKKSIAECYGNNLVRYEDQNLIGASVIEFLKIRSGVLNDEFKRKYKDLEKLSPEDAIKVNSQSSTSLEGERDPDRIDELLVELVDSSNGVTSIIQDVKSRKDRQGEEFVALRKTLEACNCEFDEGLAQEKSALLAAKTPDRLPDLRALSERFKLFIDEHVKAEKEREDLEGWRKQCVTQLTQVKDEIDKISDQMGEVPSHDVDGSQIEKLLDLEQKQQVQLRELSENLPNTPTSEIRARLEAASTEVGRLKVGSADIKQSVERRSVVGERKGIEPQTEVEFENLEIEFSEESSRQLIELLNSGRRIKSVKVIE